MALQHCNYSLITFRDTKPCINTYLQTTVNESSQSEERGQKWYQPRKNTYLKSKIVIKKSVNGISTKAQYDAESIHSMALLKETESIKQSTSGVTHPIIYLL